MTNTFSTTIVHLVLIVLYIIMAIIGFDSSSWYLMNLSIVVGVVSPILVWMKTDFKIIGFGIGYIKLALIIFFAWSWWSLFYSSKLVVEGSDFFWGMSPFLFGLGLWEVLMIHNYLLKNTSNNKA